MYLHDPVLWLPNVWLSTSDPYRDPYLKNGKNMLLAYTSYDQGRNNGGKGEGCGGLLVTVFKFPSFSSYTC